MTPFLIPKEPQPTWSMFSPHFRRRHLPAPVPGKPTYYVFWARNAIYHGLRALRLKPDDSVLAPAYHCASAIEPICQYGARVIFYNVRRDGSPDFQDLQAKIDKSTRALLAIHYFGFPQPIRELQAFCQAHHLYLIEDCAHVLVGEAEGDVLGSFGDISIFSWRKFLPLYDGGLLVINNPTCHVDILWKKNSLLFSLKITHNLLDRLIDDASRRGVKAVSLLSGLAHSLARLFMSSRHDPAPVMMTNTSSAGFALDLVNVRMSSFSQHMLQNLDFTTIVEQRRCNYDYLLKAVERLPEVMPRFPHLPEGLCPLVFPLIVQRVPNFHHVLRANGIPAFAWDGVIHPQLNIQEFPDAAFLYHHLVLLPIHQGLGTAEMDRMTEVIAEALSCSPSNCSMC